MLLKAEYKEFEDIVNIEDIIGSYLEELNNYMENLNMQWEKNHLNFNVDEVSEWSSNKCLTWLNEASVIPHYLREDLISKFTIYRKNVELRIDELNIDSIVAIFGKLDNIQKSKCLEILKDLL